MSDFFGWDLIYKLSECDLKRKEDVLTLFVHFALMKAGYKCIGIGEDKTITGNESTTETLPSCWNDAATYSIRYLMNNTLFILKGMPVDNNIVYNLLRNKEMKVTTVAFDIGNTVKGLKGNLQTLIPQCNEIYKKIQQDLVEPMGKENTKEASTQASTSQPAQDRGTPAHPSGIPIGGPPLHPLSEIDPLRDPMRVGRADLDPFAQGGGMIFDPFGSGPRAGPPGGFPNLPRGSVPPGARFDPIGPHIPQNPRRRFPPDSDEFPPPGSGGFEGMFM